MGTKRNPGKYDCYSRALPDEPMFVLLARDPVAPLLVRQWVTERLSLITAGVKPESDREVVKEAMKLAEEMELWRMENWPPEKKKGKKQ